MNKNGLCPNCGIDWDMGDIKSVLEGVEIFSEKSKTDMNKIAGMYGWTEFNKGNFSNLLLVTVADMETNIAKCPNIRCNHCFDIASGDEYANEEDALLKENKIERIKAEES